MNRELADVVRNQHALTVMPTDTVQAACKKMHDQRAGCVLVLSETGTLAGIFTGRDAVRALALGKDAGATPVKAVMTKGPTSMLPSGTAIEALRLMHDGGFRHMPVVEDGRVLGVASNTDFRGLEQDQFEQEIGIWERIA